MKQIFIFSNFSRICILEQKMKQNSAKVVECKISITFCSFTGLAENQKVLFFAEKIKFCKTCEVQKVIVI